MSRAAARKATDPRTRAAFAPNMASATSRATRSSWPLAPTGSRTKGQKRPGRTLLRNPPNERLSKQPRTPAKGTHRSNTSMEPKAGGQEKDKTGPRLSPGENGRASGREREVKRG